LKKWIVVWALIFPFVSYAGNQLLISDIDDTLKATHVLDRDDLLINGVTVGQSFEGASDLFNIWSSFPGRQVKYVSGVLSDILGSDILAKTSQAFLVKYKFPKGEFFSRPSIFEGLLQYKVETISKILQAEDPSLEIILIGDNGQLDPDVFFEVGAAFPKRKIYSFVHQVYDSPESAPNYSDQIGWLTAADLGVSMFARGWISEQDLSKILVDIRIRFESDNGFESVIPKWVNCRDFWKAYRRPSVKFSDPKNIELTQEIESLYSNRCQAVVRK